MVGWKQKRHHMHHYNRTARLYNMRYAQEQNLKINKAVENLELRRKSILDLGCGTGLLLSKMHKMVENIVSVDVSKNMIKQVEPAIRHSHNVHIIQADADHIPLRYNYFDVVFTITLLQNMPHPNHTLQEIKRTAKPNASIIVTGLKKHFTEHSFLNLLADAKLKCELLKTNDHIKCHITICKKYD